MRWIQEHVLERDIILLVLLVEKATLRSWVCQSLEKRLDVGQYRRG